MTSWINRSVGVAARNGTTSHTVSFTAASSGSLLVVIVAGSVTNTMTTGGYTKKLGPVNNTECSVFTKTASAGESSFTVSHNASNYPVNYAVYEFPAGSTWGGGTSSANTSTWPTLSSLTGTLSVFGALSELRANGDTTVTGTSTSPWLEDLDSCVLFSTTEGDWLYVTFQDGFTSSSATPVTTEDAGGGRTSERAVFAISVAAAATNPALPPTWPTRRRALPPRRPRQPVTPVRGQVNPPAPPQPARAIRQQRGFLPRRPEIAQVVPPQQTAAQAPALAQRVTRERLQTLLRRLGQRGDVTAPSDQTTPPALPVARRRPPLRRPPSVQAPAPAIPPPPVPRPAAPRRRWVLARRPEIAALVPTQVTVQPPAWPTNLAKVRRLWALPRRGHAPMPVPAQVVVTPPVWPTSLTKTRRAAVPPRRSHVAGPVPAQAAPVVPAWPPAPPRPRRLAAVLRRRGAAPAPAVQAQPVPAPGAPHARTRPPARPRRPAVAMPTRAQVNPPWVPVLVRGLRRVVATVRRTRPAGWIFGGQGVVGATQGFAGPGDGRPVATAGGGDGLPPNTSGPGDGTTFRATGG